ncbi:hypothetical protein FQN54_003501 [Arachnomyces sp. PD_36]|nr:hypothetical protein FQN54_003501 [Arachnomyces sp. PD_36]
MTTPDALRDAEHIADVRYLEDDFDDGSSSSSIEGAAESTEVGIRAARKIILLDRLRRDLDIMVYCELSSLYYMDCSVITFAIRGVTQLLFFTPKPGPVPESPRTQPYIGAIVLSNFACILLHLLFAQPAPSEALRGYLHGGFLIDFVGQHGPISKFTLLIFDILVLILQLIMMGVIQERARANQLIPIISSGDTTISDVSNGQDHDLEERGVHRTDTEHRHGHSSEDIELQDIPLSGPEDTAEDRSRELNELLAEPADGSQIFDSEAHPLDVFFSGESTIMDMQLLRSITDQWQSAGAGSTEASVYATSRSYPAALFTGGLRVRGNMGSV